ncbi:hypothetical protein [Luteolibacter soli]|uniref:Uncharacterized protein n=1 Tax=Luteolibacter soli TaxID=3135280 RepID=A0ABU9AV80_9BACT
MKPHLSLLLRLAIVTTGCITLAAILSHQKALELDEEILQPCLSPGMTYHRAVQFSLFNPFVSLLPHWTITYFEEPVDIAYVNPTITVDFLGQITSASKEAGYLLIERGYLDNH